MTLDTTQMGGVTPWPLRVANVGPATSKPLTPRPAITGIYRQTITAPAAGSTTAFMSTGVAGPNATTATYSAGGANFDGTLGATGIIPVARNVVVTVTHVSSVVACSGTITGEDQYGRTITEDWSVTATGTSKTFTGAKAFKKVTSITITAAGDSSANTVRFGTGNVFGLAFPTACASLLKEYEDITLRTNGTLVAASSSASADRRGTYAPNTTPNGTINWNIWYLVEDFTAI